MSFIKEIDDIEGSVSSVKPHFLRMEEMRAELERQVRKCDGVKNFCRKKRINSHPPVSLALSGERDVTDGIANAMGYVTEKVFRKL